MSIVKFDGSFNDEKDFINNNVSKLIVLCNHPAEINFI